MPSIKFKIVTPERIVFEQDVDQVTLPTTEGEITVLPHHLPLVSMIQSGQLVVKYGGQETAIAVHSGFVQIRDNEVVVLTENAERAEEIDEARAEAARARAEELMRDAKNRSDVNFAGLAAKIERELARIKVARRRKHSTKP